MKKSLIALAFGTLGLGIAEFTMMGILPYVATDLGISIPVAGHFISAYALGVCFGAPMLLLARKRPLKQILLVLMALMIVGNICASMAPNYWVLLLGGSRYCQCDGNHCRIKAQAQRGQDFRASGYCAIVSRSAHRAR